METYIYKVKNSSGARGFNQTITVYLLRGNNRPIFVGYSDEINIASTKGEYAEACQIIANNSPHKLSKGGGDIGAGYSMESKNINIYSI